MILGRLIVVICVFLSLGTGSLAMPQSFSFVVFGDNRDGDKVFMDLITKVNHEKDLAFAVNTGDFVSWGKESGYKNYLRMISNLNIKLYNVPGNHDLVKHGYQYFKKYFGPYYYSFDYMNAHFIILNNAFRQSFHPKQFSWLKKDLATTDQDNIFVFLHKPTFDPTELYAGQIMSSRETVKQLMRVFKKYKVDYVFAGHIHGYAKAKRDGVVYVVTGGGGAPIHLSKDFGGFHHYVRIDVVGDQIEDKVVKIY